MRSAVLLALALGAALAALVALMGTAREAEAAFPGDNGKIVFSSNKVTATNPTGDYEIFTMNPDGSQLTQLTDNTGSDERYPALSPEGKKIVFVSNLVTATNPTGGYEIFTMNSDGTRKKARTNIDHYGTDSPDWQPLVN